MDEDTLAFIDRSVRSGFRTRNEIIESVAEYADEAVLDQMDVIAAVDAMIEEHRLEASTWPAETDNDRLDRAFAQLDASGVIARQDFACCQSCGQAEIWDEVDEPAAWRGYVFFHQQDTERAVEGDGLYLGFGTSKHGIKTSILGLLRPRARPASPSGADEAIGREIVAALAASGLRARWDGSVATRILVEPFHWRRRSPG